MSDGVEAPRDTVTVRCPDCGVVILRVEQLTIAEPRDVEHEERCRVCKGDHPEAA